MKSITIILLLVLGAVVSAEYNIPRSICDRRDKWLSRDRPLFPKLPIIGLVPGDLNGGRGAKPSKSSEGPMNYTLGQDNSNKATRMLKEEDNNNIYSWHMRMQYLVNVQIRNELNAFYNYLRMSRFFQNYDESRPGFAKFFRDAANEELEHAEMFMSYQQLRGGEVTMWDIPAPTPSKTNWTNGKDVLEAAYELEKSISDEVLCLHKLAADKFNDVDFLNFLEEKVIPEQYESMKSLKTHIKNLERACPKVDGKPKMCDAYPLYELNYDAKLK